MSMANDSKPDLSNTKLPSKKTKILKKKRKTKNRLMMKKEMRKKETRNNNRKNKNRNKSFNLNQTLETRNKHIKMVTVNPNMIITNKNRSIKNRNMVKTIIQARRREIDSELVNFTIPLILFNLYQSIKIPHLFVHYFGHIHEKGYEIKETSIRLFFIMKLH